MFKFLRRHMALKAARAEGQAAAVARIRAAEKDMFAAAVKVCWERNAKPGTVEMVMQSFRDNEKLTEEELIARRESGVDPYAHWDDTAWAAQRAASLVLLEAVMPPYQSQ